MSAEEGTEVVAVQTTEEKVYDLLTEAFTLQDSEAVDIAAVIKIGKAFGQWSAQSQDELEAYFSDIDLNSDGKVTLEEFIGACHDTFTVTALTYGKGKAYVSMLRSSKWITSTFSKKAKASSDMTTIRLGNPVTTPKSSLHLEVDVSQAYKKHFDKHEDASFVLVTEMKLNGPDSMAFIQKVLEQCMRITNSISDSINSVTEYEECSHEVLRMYTTFISSSDDSGVGELLQATIETVYELISKVMFTYKWAHSVEDIFSISIIDLLDVEFAVSLASLPSIDEFIHSFATSFEDLGFTSQEEMFDAVPGLRDVVGGHYNQTIDLSKFIRSKLSLAEEMGIDVTTSLKELVKTFGPMFVMAANPFEEDMKPANLISAVRGFLGLLNLYATRDVQDFITAEVRTRDGNGFRFDFNNIFKISTFFSFADNLLEALEEVTLEQQAMLEHDGEGDGMNFEFHDEDEEVEEDAE